MEPIDARRRGPSPWLGAALVVLGLLLGTAATVKIVSQVARTAWGSINAPELETPGTAEVDLGEGRHLVFARVLTTLSPELVRVTDGSTGERVPVRPFDGDETIGRDGRSYVAVLQLDAPVSGRYSVTFDTAEPGGALVARSLTKGFEGLGRWFALGATGVLVLVLGAILLIVAFVDRRRGS